MCLAGKGVIAMERKLVFRIGSVLAVPVLGLAGGCATITRGTSEAFVIESEPPGAHVRLSTGETCRTPCTLKKKRKESFVVHIEKPGYEPVEVQVTNQVAGAGAAGMAGNVILGGLIGAAVDAGSGAMLELVPNPVRVKLVPLGDVRREEDSGGPSAPEGRPDAASAGSGEGTGNAAAGIGAEDAGAF